MNIQMRQDQGMQWKSNFCKFFRSGCVSEGWNQLFFPVPSHSFVRHHVKVTVSQLNYSSLANWFSIFEPLIMQRLTLSSTKPNRNDFLSFCVSVETDSTFIYVEIVISFSCQLTSLVQEDIQSFSDFGKQRNFCPWHNSSFACLIFWFLTLIREAEIVSCVFGHYSTIHESFDIPVQLQQFFKEIFSVSMCSLKQAISPFLDNQDAGLRCFYLDVFVQVDNLAFVSPLLKFGLGFLHLVNSEAFVSCLPNNLHANMIFSLISKGDGDRTHISFGNIQLDKSLKQINGFLIIIPQKQIEIMLLKKTQQKWKYRSQILKD